jgi:hypothetical protein
MTASVVAARSRRLALAALLALSLALASSVIIPFAPGGGRAAAGVNIPFKGGGGQVP